MGFGFAGEDDLGEEDGPGSAAHSSDVKPSLPSAPASGSGAAYGFAAGDSDEDEDEDGPGQDRPAVAVPAPAGETAYGFAGSSDDDDDDDHHDEAMQRLEPAPLPAGSAVNADAPIVPTAETATTSFGFATADDDDDTDDDHEAMQPLDPAVPPAASAAHAEAPVVATTEIASTSFGFAGDDDDDDDDDMYFPDLTPFEQARAAAAVAQPAGQAMLERVKMEDTPHGFAGASDDEEDDDLGGPAVDNAAATLAQGDVDMEEGTAQDEVSTNNQRGSEARAQEKPRQTPEATPTAEAARAEPIGNVDTDETAQVGGKTRDVGDEQQKLAESPAADAAMNEPSLATRHEAEVASAAVAQSARAAPESQASAPSTAMSPPPATGAKTAPARPALEKDNRASRQPAKLTTATNGEQGNAAAGSAAQPRVSSSPVASRQSALPHSGREASRDQSEDADAAFERARLPTKRKRTADTTGDAAEAGGEATGTALARVKIRRKGDSRAGEVSPVETRPSPGPSGGSDSRGSGSAIKAADPFNHGRIRSNVSNGYIRWNAAALRSKNFSQTLTAGERISWPDDGPYSVFDGSGDVESEKIKFLWSMGRYGDPINGTDTIDELFNPLSDKKIDVWIAPPPDENKAGLSKTARAHSNEYQALQLVLSSYEGLRQADSPRNSVKIVFVHVSKLGELGSTTGAFAQLEHLRCQPGTRFFVYGRGENSKRAVFQFWRTGA